MENGVGVVSAASENQEQQGASYKYWVREATADAAPLPVPKKLSPDDILSNKSQPATLGSVWNRVPLFFLIFWWFVLMIQFRWIIGFYFS